MASNVHIKTLYNILKIYLLCLFMCICLYLYESIYELKMWSGACGGQRVLSDLEIELKWL